MRAHAHLPVHTAPELFTPTPTTPLFLTTRLVLQSLLNPPHELGHGTGVQFYPASFRAHFNTRHISEAVYPTKFRLSPGLVGCVGFNRSTTCWTCNTVQYL